MKRIIIFIVAAFALNTLSAQIRYFDERYISTLSFLNPVLINPGATGNQGVHRLSINYKNKWATFPGSPKSFIASYDGPVAERLGFGVMFVSDSNGSLETNKVQGSVAYAINSPTNRISAGFSGEYIKHGLSGDVPFHQLIDSGDEIIGQRIAGESFFDVSLGAQGVYDGVITYGLTLPSLVSSRLTDNALNEFDREMGYILNVGYIYKRSDADVTLEPSVFVKSVNNVPFHADINLLGRFVEDKFRGGVTYTVGADQKLGFIIGTTINSMNFTYGYNASRHEFQTYNNGSHELSLSFDIGSKKDSEVMMKEEGMMEEKLMEGINN